MLNYDQQYNIANGLFLTYDQQMDKRLLHTSHGKAVRDKMEGMFPYRKYESRTRETFILACLYIIFTNTPSSYRALVTELKELDIKEIASFRFKINNYHDLMKADIIYLTKELGGTLNSNKMINEYISGNIQFYTLWFYFMFNPKEDIETLKSSRVFSHVYRKLKFIMMFLTFSQEAVNDIQILFNEMEI
ncbi:MAG: hypothetical protein KAI79_14010 [Bacteroidales bacterium]|nr:hypothetical protein [Bacteroidales bacterium]